jgi:hypothetical protein
MRNAPDAVSYQTIISAVIGFAGELGAVWEQQYFAWRPKKADRATSHDVIKLMLLTLPCGKVRRPASCVRALYFGWKQGFKWNGLARAGLLS